MFIFVCSIAHGVLEFSSSNRPSTVYGIGVVYFIVVEYEHCVLL